MRNALCEVREKTGDYRQNRFNSGFMERDESRRKVDKGQIGCISSTKHWIVSIIMIARTIFFATMISMCSLLLIVIRPPIAVCLPCQWDLRPRRMLTRHIPMTSRKVQLIRRTLRARAASLIMILMLRLEDPPAHLQQLPLQDQKVQVLHNYHMTMNDTDAFIQLFDLKIPLFSQLTKLFLASLNVRVSHTLWRLYGVLNDLFRVNQRD